MAALAPAIAQASLGSRFDARGSVATCDQIPMQPIAFDLKPAPVCAVTFDHMRQRAALVACRVLRFIDKVKHERRLGGFKRILARAANNSFHGVCPSFCYGAISSASKSATKNAAIAASCRCAATYFRMDFILKNQRATTQWRYSPPGTSPRRRWI